LRFNVGEHRPQYTADTYQVSKEVKTISSAITSFLLSCRRAYLQSRSVALCIILENKDDLKVLISKLNAYIWHSIKSFSVLRSAPIDLAEPPLVVVRTMRFLINA